MTNPPGASAESRRELLDGLRQLHEHQFAGLPVAEIAARIDNYELGFRMQASVPEVTNLSDEPRSVLDLYGPDARDPGTFAANCLLARRLAERGVRFIQLYHQDWDHHGGIQEGLQRECRQTDQPVAARVQDLANRGMLDDTLVVLTAAENGGAGRSKMMALGGIDLPLHHSVSRRFAAAASRTP